jgi:hypothetical protein
LHVHAVDLALPSGDRSLGFRTLACGATASHQPMAMALVQPKPGDKRQKTELWIAIAV